MNSVHATSQVRFEETNTERQRNLIRLGFTSTRILFIDAIRTS